MYRSLKKFLKYLKKNASFFACCIFVGWYIGGLLEEDMSSGSDEDWETPYEHKMQPVYRSYKKDGTEDSSKINERFSSAENLEKLNQDNAEFDKMMGALNAGVRKQQSTDAYAASSASSGDSRSRRETDAENASNTSDDEDSNSNPSEGKINYKTDQELRLETEERLRHEDQQKAFEEEFSIQRIDHNSGFNPLLSSAEDTGNSFSSGFDNGPDFEPDEEENNAMNERRRRSHLGKRAVKLGLGGFDPSHMDEEVAKIKADTSLSDKEKIASLRKLTRLSQMMDGTFKPKHDNPKALRRMERMQQTTEDLPPLMGPGTHGNSNDLDLALMPDVERRAEMALRARLKREQIQAERMKQEEEEEANHNYIQVIEDATGLSIAEQIKMGNVQELAQAKFEQQVAKKEAEMRQAAAASVLKEKMQLKERLAKAKAHGHSGKKIIERLEALESEGGESDTPAPLEDKPADNQYVDMSYETNTEPDLPYPDADYQTSNEYDQTQAEKFEAELIPVEENGLIAVDDNGLVPVGEETVEEPVKPTLMFSDVESETTTTEEPVHFDALDGILAQQNPQAEQSLDYEAQYQAEMEKIAKLKAELEGTGPEPTLHPVEAAYQKQLELEARSIEAEEQEKSIHQEINDLHAEVMANQVHLNNGLQDHMPDHIHDGVGELDQLIADIGFEKEKMVNEMEKPKVEELDIDALLASVKTPLDEETTETEPPAIVKSGYVNPKSGPNWWAENSQKREDYSKQAVAPSIEPTPVAPNNLEFNDYETAQKMIGQQREIDDLQREMDFVAKNGVNGEETLAALAENAAKSETVDCHIFVTVKDRADCRRAHRNGNHGTGAVDAAPRAPADNYQPPAELKNGGIPAVSGVSSASNFGNNEAGADHEPGAGKDFLESIVSYDSEGHPDIEASIKKLEEYLSDIEDLDTYMAMSLDALRHADLTPEQKTAIRKLKLFRIRLEKSGGRKHHTTEEKEEREALKASREGSENFDRKAFLGNLMGTNSEDGGQVDIEKSVVALENYLVNQGMDVEKFLNMDLDELRDFDSRVSFKQIFYQLHHTPTNEFSKIF